MPTGRRTSPARLTLALASAAVIALVVPGAVTAQPRPSLAEVQQQVDDLEHQAEQAAERYNAAEDQLAEVQRRLDTAQADVARQEAKVQELTKSMGGFAAASYRTGIIDPTMQLFLAEKPDDFIAQASVIDAYASSQVGALRGVAVERQKLDEQRAEADEERNRLSAVEQQLADEKKAIDDKVAKAERLLSTLRAEERAALERQRAADTTSRGTTREAAAAVAVPASGRAAAAVQYAMNQLGDRYVYGAEGPDAFDCSGLTMMAWRAAGVSIPRSSRDQINAGVRVSKSELLPGDLVFFYSPISHVGIYIGNGNIIDASRPGKPISVRSMEMMPYSGASRPG